MSDETKSMEVVPVQSPGNLMVQDPLAGLADMMHAAMARGLTTENVSVMKEMLGMFERMDAKQAEKAFTQALARIQSFCRGRVHAVKPVPNNDGSIRYRYADLDEIMTVVQPALDREGMAVSFDTTYENNRLFAICELSHKGGHKASKRYGVQIGTGPPKASITQADGSAITYAKRGAICNWFNIVANKDNDGAGGDDVRDLGSYITPEQAKSLRARVLATGSNMDAFLKYAQSPVSDQATEADIVLAFERIPSSMYPTLDTTLRKKENTK